MTDKRLLVTLSLTAAITQLLAENPKALDAGSHGDYPHIGSVNPWSGAPKLPKHLLRKDPKHKARI